MAEFILKDWYGKDCKFDHDTIFVQDANGELVQFTQGEGNPTLEELYVEENGTYKPNEGVDGFSSVTVDVPERVPVLQNKTITEDGTYTADEGFDGFGRVEVKVDDVNELLLSNFEVTGFAEDATLGGYSEELTFGTDLDAFGVIDGREYTVGWDDELYTVNAKDTRQIIEEPDGEGGTLYRSMYYLGNGELLGIDGLEGNDEPFAILWTQGKGLTIVTTDTAERHVLTLVKRVRPREALDMLLESKTITENGTYTANEVYDGFKQIVVDVAGTSSADVRYVTFMSYDGLTEYGKKAVAVGDDCADPIARGIFATPTRESDAQYNYTHNGWSTAPNGSAVSNWNKAITEDKTVYASFASALRYYTITYYDSDGTTVLKTESLAYGSMPSYSPTKEGVVFAGWSPTISAVTGDTSYTASWSEKLTFADATWADIARVAEAGEASQHFAIGDTRTIETRWVDYNGNIINTTSVFEIIGFGYDNLADGTGKAGITIASNRAFEKSQFIGDISSTIKAGYENTTIHTNMNSVGFANLPDDLQTHIKEITKAGISAGFNAKVWIPSNSEFTSLTNQYEHYKTASNRIKLAQSKTTLGDTAVEHMTRSRVSSTSNFNYYIDKTGASKSNAAYFTYCVVAFCI